VSASPIGAWRRLHPLSPVVRVGRRAVTLVVVLAFPFISSGRVDPTDGLIDLAIICVVAVGGVVSWLVTRWRVDGGMVQVETGLLRRQKTRVPLSRIQSVDVVRPGTARVFGLAEVRVRTGGGHAGDVRLAYLTGNQAERVQAFLLVLAHGGTLPVAQVAARPLARVYNPRLMLALLLRWSAVAPLVVAVALVLGAALLGGGAVAQSLVGSALAIAVGGGLALLRQINSLMSYEVTEAMDGLHVRGGLIATVVETIPRRRIQALRQTEPLLWRGLGWAGLSVDVAGGQRRSGEDRGAAGQLRALSPVATVAESAQLLADLLPGARPGDGRPSPAVARVKAPLSYHFLRGGVSGGLAVSGAGRLQRTTTWVPLAKVQSIRWVQGPIQRRLGLATVHLDIAGRRVGVALRDRSAAEAVELAEQLPGLCRAAREAAREHHQGPAAEKGEAPAAG